MLKINLKKQLMNYFQKTEMTISQIMMEMKVQEKKMEMMIHQITIKLVKMVHQIKMKVKVKNPLHMMHLME